MIKNIVHTIRMLLLKNNITPEITYRLKDPISALKKMLSKEPDSGNLCDLIAIRIIVNTNDNCYASLGLIHTVYKPDLTKFKDYIQDPKNNGYQSLHTIIINTPFKRDIEVQIRTNEMHEIVEVREANHSQYKQKQESCILCNAINNKISLNKANDIFQKFNWTLPALVNYEKELMNLYQHLINLDKTSS